MVLSMPGRSPTYAALLLGPRWTMPGGEIDLRGGREYRYVWRERRRGHKMGTARTFTEIVRPSRIVATSAIDEDWTGGPKRSSAPRSSEETASPTITTDALRVA